MKSKTFIKICHGILLIFFLAISLVMSEVHPNYPYPRKELRLTIKTELLDYLPGYPVMAYVYLDNLSFEFSNDVIRCLEPEYGFVEYFIKTPEGKEIAFIPWAYKEHPDPVRSISPGGTMRAAAKIFFGANGWTFTTPGEYKLKAVYLKKVVSNEWPISIVHPRTDSLKQAMNMFFESPEIGYFLLFDGGEHLEDAKKKLEMLSSQSSANHRYQVYADFSLGVNLMRDCVNFKNNRVRKANYQLAADYLEKVKTRRYSFYHAIYTHLYLAEAYMKLGQSDRAHKALNQDLDQTKAWMAEYYHDFPEWKDFLDDILKKKNPLTQKK